MSVHRYLLASTLLATTLLALPIVSRAAVDPSPNGCVSCHVLDQAKGVAEPWTDPGFVDRIVALQRHRRLAASGEVQFHDRSAFCTEALATFLGHSPSGLLAREIGELKETGFYDRRVFFVRLMGFVEPTAARRIGLEEATRFEGVHERTYRAHGFEPVFVEPASVVDRVAAIRRSL